MARTSVRVSPVSRTMGPAALAVPRLSMISRVRYNSTKPEEPKDTKEAAAEGEAAPAAETSPAEETPAEDPALTELKSKLTEKDKQLAEMKNHYSRAIADFRNLQETTKKEMQKAKDFALQKFAKDLLESLDNFGLALNSVKEETLKVNEEVKNLFEGVSMTKSVFEKTLERHGIEKIDPMGETFDPNQHEATFEIPHADKEPGTIFHVQLPGYTLNKRVLRPAKVGLVKDVEN